MDDEHHATPAFGAGHAAAGAHPDFPPDAHREPFGGGTRRAIYGMAGAIVLALAGAAGWVGYEMATGSAIAQLGQSMTRPATPTPMPAPARQAVPAIAAESVAQTTPDAAMARPAAPPPVPSAQELLGPGPGAATVADKRPAPALVRDLPDWLATEMGAAPRRAVKGRMRERAEEAAEPVAASAGASDDESAAPEPRHARRQRGDAQNVTERAAQVFARCPKPGVPGAVECRRAVCAGAARKQPVCSAYTD